MEKRLDELNKRLAEISAREQAILAEAGEEPLSEEQSKELDALDAEHGQLVAERERLEADFQRRARAASHVQERSQPRSRRAQLLQPAGDQERINIIREGFEADPKHGFHDLNEFLFAIMESTQKRQINPRLHPFRAAAGADEQSTTSDPFGGFLIPTSLAPGLLSRPSEPDPVSGRVTMVPMETPTLVFNARVDHNHTTSVSGGLTVGTRAETQAASASRMQFEQVELKATGIFGVTYATEEILERSPTSFIALLTAGFADEYAAYFMKKRIHGTGVGEFEGVLNTPCLVSVEKETGQAAKTIVFENIAKMVARCWGFGNAIWLANHDTLPQLAMLNQTVGSGGAPIYVTDAREGMPASLMGRPIFYTEFCKTLGTKGDLILGNWSQYLEGVLAPLRSAESIHVRFLEHERAFKFWQEKDGRVWWRAALTPAESDATLSPFVVLDTRA